MTRIRDCHLGATSERLVALGKLGVFAVLIILDHLPQRCQLFMDNEDFVILINWKYMLVHFSDSLLKEVLDLELFFSKSVLGIF